MACVLMHPSVDASWITCPRRREVAVGAVTTSLSLPVVWLIWQKRLHEILAMSVEPSPVRITSESVVLASPPSHSGAPAPTPTLAPATLHSHTGLFGSMGATDFAGLPVRLACFARRCFCLAFSASSNSKL